MNSLSVNIRTALPGDEDLLTRIINKAFRSAEAFFVNGDRIDLQEVGDLLRRGTFLLAEDQGKGIGCVYVEPIGNRAYLGLLSVEPPVQRCGLGSLLMRAGERYCIDRGCEFIDLKIVNVRSELPEFYEKRGYIESGTSAFPAEVETKVPCWFIDMSKRIR
ncbi:MAG: GNAT family N-acetyltransferase [Pyrinomonadaceae bacterium]